MSSDPARSTAEPAASATVQSTDVTGPEPPAPNQPGSSEPRALSDLALSDLTPSELINLNQNVLNELISQRPLIEDAESMGALRAEYESGSVTFLKQIDALKDLGLCRLRRTRGDGDCFYRAIGYTFVEQVLQAPEQDIAVASALSLLESTPEWLDAVGFQKLVYEDFYDVLYSLIRNIAEANVGGYKLTELELLERFQDPSASNSIVAFLRLLTSAQLRLNEDEYSPFLLHPDLGEPMGVREFCENFVEGSGKEADHVQITALCRVLRLNVKVAYLDGRSDFIDFVDFQNGSTSQQFINLLYRPGHYDILLKDHNSV